MYSFLMNIPIRSSIMNIFNMQKLIKQFAEATVLYYDFLTFVYLHSVMG